MDVSQAGFTVLFLAFLAGCAVGTLLAVFVLHSRHSNRIVMDRLRVEAERIKLVANLENLQISLETSQRANEERDLEIAALTENLLQLNSKNARLEESLQNEKANAAEKISLLNKAETNM